MISEEKPTQENNKTLVNKTIVNKKPQVKKSQQLKPSQEKVSCGVCEKMLARGSLRSHMKSFHEKKTATEEKKEREDDKGNTTYKEAATEEKKVREEDKCITTHEEGINTFRVKVQVIKEHEKNEQETEEEVVEENEVNDEKTDVNDKSFEDTKEIDFDGEEETELEMRDHIEGMELAEAAALVSQEVKEKEKKALKPNNQFFLSTMTGLDLQEMFNSSAFDNLLEDSETPDDEIEILENHGNDDVATIIGDVLKETVKRAETKDKMENAEFVRNYDMTRPCPNCEKKFGGLADLIRHMMQEHEPFKKPECGLDPVPYMLGELMSELGEEMGGMRTQTEKFQKDILRQLNFETQALKQDLMNKINEMVQSKPESNDLKSQETVKVNTRKQPTKDTKTAVGCYDCEKTTQQKRHIHCLECETFFGNKNDLMRHIQEVHVEEIKSQCDSQCCSESNKEKDEEIKRLNEVIQVNSKILQETMDENETLKEQNKIILNIQGEELNNESDTEQEQDEITKEYLKCINCEFVTSEATTLKDHISKKHRNPEIVCPKCSNAF